jgi:photosystem II stability/assembly factor-like uncharacterized protein
MSDREPRQSPLAAPDTYPRDAEAAEDDMPRVSSLRPTSHIFSQRRLLNGISVAIAGVVVLALAIHWLPAMLPGHAPPQSPRSMPQSASGRVLLPPTRGSNWRSIGPNWALDIAFTANGALGYVCGASLLKPTTFFAVYDVHQRTWVQFPTPATIGGACHVSVSPTNISDVALIASTTGDTSNSQLFRSLDGGETWSQLNLPKPYTAVDTAWTNDSTLLVTGEKEPRANTSQSVTSKLFVSRQYGSLTEITSQQLVGHTGELGLILLQSSGTVVYAAIAGTSCTSYCSTRVRSTDDGRHWARFTATYRGNPLIPTAPQPNTGTISGWSFMPATSQVVPLRSDDAGATWHNLPAFPVNPNIEGTVLFALPDGSVYAWCFAPANVVYALSRGAPRWHIVAPLSTGIPLAVQPDNSGHAVALWGQSIVPTSATGLEYYPLATNAP